MNNINPETLTCLTSLAGLKQEDKSTYLFPDCVRERCPHATLENYKHPKPHKLCTNEVCDCPCPYCSRDTKWICCDGCGWNPSTDLMVWLKAVAHKAKRGATITLSDGLDHFCVNYLGSESCANDPLEALSSALEQYYQNQERNGV